MFFIICPPLFSNLLQKRLTFAHFRDILVDDNSRLGGLFAQHNW